MNLHLRLRSLERAAGTGPRVCRCCGHSPGKRPPGGAGRRYVVTTGEAEQANARSEVCTECGERLVFNVEFDRGNG